MTNAPTRVQWGDLVRAEKWTPWKAGWAETSADSPVAAKASVARFKAVNDRIDAYEKRQPRTMDKQKDTEELESRRARLQSELDRWRQDRARDEKVYQDMIRKTESNDPSGEVRETYRGMHLQCDRVWLERIQLKKEELAALVTRG